MRRVLIAVCLSLFTLSLWGMLAATLAAQPPVAPAKAKPAATAKVALTTQRRQRSRTCRCARWCSTKTAWATLSTPAR